MRLHSHVLGQPITDILVPAAEGSIMRAYSIEEPGIWRLARRDAEIYSVLVLSCGAWGRILVLDGDLRPIWHQPSTFTGSFVINAHTPNGLIVVCATSAIPSLNVNWREPDASMV